MKSFILLVLKLFSYFWRIYVRILTFYASKYEVKHKMSPYILILSRIWSQPFQLTVTSTPACSGQIKSRGIENLSDQIFIYISLSYHSHTWTETDGYRSSDCFQKGNLFLERYNLCFVKWNLFLTIMCLPLMLLIQK